MCCCCPTIPRFASSSSFAAIEATQLCSRVPVDVCGSLQCCFSTDLFHESPVLRVPPSEPFGQHRVLGARYGRRRGVVCVRRAQKEAGAPHVRRRGQTLRRSRQIVLNKLHACVFTACG